MKMSVYYRILLIITTLMVLIFVKGCHLTSESRQIIVKSDSITMTWDAPDFDAHLVVYPIDFYRVYFREYGHDSWTLIGETSAVGILEYTLQFSDFGTGRYEFAVDYVLSSGQSSLLHSSHDQTAEPFGGWYVFWIGH